MLRSKIFTVFSILLFVANYSCAASQNDEASKKSSVAFTHPKVQPASSWTAGILAPEPIGEFHLTFKTSFGVGDFSAYDYLQNISLKFSRSSDIISVPEDIISQITCPDLDSLLFRTYYGDDSPENWYVQILFRAQSSNGSRRCDLDRSEPDKNDVRISIEIPFNGEITWYASDMEED